MRKAHAAWANTRRLGRENATCYLPRGDAKGEQAGKAGRQTPTEEPVLFAQRGTLCHRRVSLRRYLALESRHSRWLSNAVAPLHHNDYHY